MIIDRNRTLREVYKLDYDNSGLRSGLTIWYNKLIDKTVADLDIFDVSKMIRQNILKEVAVGKAIELFLESPFDGEMKDGDLLALLVSINWSDFSEHDKLVDVTGLITQLESEFSKFEWMNDADGESYKRNLVILKQNLNKQLQPEYPQRQ